MTERELYLTRTADEVRNLQKMYARNAHARDFSPQSERVRFQVAERIETLLASVTLEEQVEYEIW